MELQRSILSIIDRKALDSLAKSGTGLKTGI
jgi:hypothetical protein